MKKKGLILAIFFGTIMLTSLAAGVFLNRTPPKLDSEDTKITITGTPADNFPDVQRARFCGSGDAKSTMFVKEYTIPTVCTNPLAIVADHDGNVWFAETNTGKLGKFNPAAQTFSEFDNPLWPKKGRSMMWGIDYSPDGTLWYTDEAYDSVWRFSINDQKYQRIQYPSDGNTLPQKLKVDGSQIVINDFTGNKITFLDPAQTDENLRYLSLPSPINGTVTSDFGIDSKNNVWYTNWLYQQGGGVLVKFDQEGYRLSLANTKEPSTQNYFEVFQLPLDLLTPNGLTISNDVIWLADTSNSAIFSFNPITQNFTEYATSYPKLSTYGNSTGVIKSPISRPYWIESNPAGQIIFNEQTSNSIAVMDPKTDSLVEYLIPSKNPEWGDCSGMANCGLAQIFDFTVDKNKIWFTEWAENNIGVVDTLVELPFEIEMNSTNISMKPGESKNISIIINPKITQNLPDVSVMSNDPFNFINATTSISGSFELTPNEPKPIDVTISTSADSIPGVYKVLLGAQIEDVSISKFVTVSILP